LLALLLIGIGIWRYRKPGAITTSTAAEKWDAHYSEQGGYAASATKRASTLQGGANLGGGGLGGGGLGGGGGAVAGGGQSLGDIYGGGGRNSEYNPSFYSPTTSSLRIGANGMTTSPLFQRGSAFGPGSSVLLTSSSPNRRVSTNMNMGMGGSTHPTSNNQQNAF